MDKIVPKKKTVGGFGGQDGGKKEPGLDLNPPLPTLYQNRKARGPRKYLQEREGTEVEPMLVEKYVLVTKTNIVKRQQYTSRNQDREQRSMNRMPRMEGKSQRATKCTYRLNGKETVPLGTASGDEQGN